MAERQAGVDAVAFEVAGRLEPLLACYRATLAAPWGAALAANPSFRALWQTVRGRVLPETALAAVDPGCRAVLSVNTPADARALGIAVPR